ncbi:MAG: DEAD/DEAH box helicase family protein [Myxococcales bacterium]|nr:DEAD/DEAH box helicase family protein [Myxococcales bacterium]
MGNAASQPTIELRFFAGTIEVVGLPQDSPLVPKEMVWDSRSHSHRGDGQHYGTVALALHRSPFQWTDQARRWQPLALSIADTKPPRPFQTEALAAWQQARGQGVVVLPTGAGKSWLAVMAIADRGRPTLVVAPTLDLVRQWHGLLQTAFGMEVGVVGGGEHNVLPLTVTTYDSAWIHMEHFGGRFGMVVFDEAHHLPSASYAQAARMCMAPFRLGLTATPERQDGQHQWLDELIGPICFRRDIVELSGKWLAEYDVETRWIELSDEEREKWAAERELYRAFLRDHHIRVGAPGGWGRFLMMASRSEQGRRAMLGYRRQRALALAPSGKLAVVDELLHNHRGDRTLLFTQHNATAHEVSRRFLIPAITHQTKVSERTAILDGLRDGSYRAVVTSKVLNEGVDVPSANVAIIISGSGSVREHVQRLGRVLRKQEGKRARLYELVTGDTGEAFTSARRREHSAYQ